MTRDRELIGSSIGDYRLIREIGRGGMGVVYEAYNELLDRRAALKILPPAAADHKDFAARFQREARHSVGIDHPCVVKVHHAGTTTQGGVYFVMEYVAGISMRRLVEYRKLLNGRMLPVVARQALEGLGAAHGRGIIHRDIKPDNLLATPEGHVKITDFGLARALQGSENEYLTKAGDIVGSPAYMSPEQWDGLELDVRTDLYSLGVTLYHLCCGDIPFRASGTLTLARKVATEDPRPLGSRAPALPHRLVGFVEQLMRKDREERFDDAESALAALNRAVADISPDEVARGERELGALVTFVFESMPDAERLDKPLELPPAGARDAESDSDGAAASGTGAWASGSSNPDRGAAAEESADRIATSLYQKAEADSESAVRILTSREEEETAAVLLADQLADESTEVSIPPSATDPSASASASSTGDVGELRGASDEWPPTAHPADVPLPSDMDRLEHLLGRLDRVESSPDFSISSVASMWLELEALARKPDLRASAVPALERLRSRLPRIPGFRWLRVERYAAGSRSHTVHIFRCDVLADALGLPEDGTNITCEFVLVPSGSFRMGSPDDEPGRDDDEGPQRRVILRPYLIARTPITQELWTAISGDNPSWFRPGREGAPQVTDRLPVENLAFPQIHGPDGFIRQLGVQGLHLPTEAEWEYACRARSKEPYFFGSDESVLQHYAWYTANAGECTHEVGSRAPNAFGLYDMLGNVRERVRDTWTPHYEGLPQDGTALVDDDATHMVSRGGCCWSPAHECRAAARKKVSPEHRAHNLGFRLACDVPVSPDEKMKSERLTRVTTRRFVAED